MNITYETRLNLDCNEKEIIDTYCKEFSHIAKFAWKLKNNLHLADEQITPKLMKYYNLTFNQANSIRSYIVGEYSKLEELKKYELKQLKKNISQREKFIQKINVKITQSNNKLNKLSESKVKLKNKLNTKVKTEFNHITPKDTLKVSSKLIQALKDIDSIKLKIKHFNSIIKPKKKVLVKMNSSLILLN